MSPLAKHVKKHGVGPKLKRIVMHERGWKEARFGEGGESDWYRNRPTFSLELEAAIVEARSA